MWKDLSLTDRNEYKRMILAFASLTEMFAQKASTEESIPSPIINSKYQETVFQKVFKANPEDIGNTSYDASICITDNSGKNKKYLIGIKTFGISSGDQKVAQFKAMHDEWANILNQIQQNSYNTDGSMKTKQEIDLVNKDLYKDMAIRIASLRNLRIDSSEANLQGFSIINGKDSVEAVYHVLMPSKKGLSPSISVGETSYNKIDIGNIKILGCTTQSNPTNFAFEDGNHKYKFTSADSQLLMSFNNEEIVLETWPVTYAEDAYAIFKDIAERIYGYNAQLLNTQTFEFTPPKVDDSECAEPEIKFICKPSRESHSWLIPVERYSGFNSFYGVGSKLATNDRENRINKLKLDFENSIDSSLLENVISGLQYYILHNSRNDSDRIKKESCRNDILEMVKTTGNTKFISAVEKLLFRPVDEMYIPIPKAKEFHNRYPDFFGPNIGTFKNNSSKLKNDKNHCSFNLIFEPSGEKMRAYITQDNGKAIESCEKQSILGNWLRNYVFQLKEYEPLTSQRLKELGINGIRLYKTTESDDVHLKFIYIDSSSLPTDFFN